MDLKLDLHVHSAISPDGCMPIEEIVSCALQKGIHGVAICDHNTVYSKPSEFSDFVLIPGAEFSTEYGHLLGLFVKEPIPKGDFFETVSAIHAQGGIAVLAHPFEHTSSSMKIDEIARFLDGVEVWNSRALRKNRQANQLAMEFAQRHGLLLFAGSDAHLPKEIGSACMTIKAEDHSLSAIKSALRKPGARISGKRSSSRYTAASQWILLKNTRAPMKKYCKWALFAAKCCLDDFLEGVCHVFDRKKRKESERNNQKNNSAC